MTQKITTRKITMKCVCSYEKREYDKNKRAFIGSMLLSAHFIGLGCFAADPLSNYGPLFSCAIIATYMTASIYVLFKTLDYLNDQALKNSYVLIP